MNLLKQYAGRLVIGKLNVQVSLRLSDTKIPVGME